MKTLTVSALVCAIMTLCRADESSQLVMTPTSCPGDWTAINGRCFLFVARELNWSRAEKNCQTRGANLASVHSAEEYLEIQNMILRMARRHRKSWLGGSDSQTEGTWLWIDGTPFDYRHCGKFNNMWWRQDCLQMNYGANNCWDDVQCSSKRPFVCSKKP